MSTFNVGSHSTEAAAVGAAVVGGAVAAFVILLKVYLHSLATEVVVVMIEDVISCLLPRTNRIVC